jgi:hypothetical protein
VERTRFVIGRMVGGQLVPLADVDLRAPLCHRDGCLRPAARNSEGVLKLYCSVECRAAVRLLERDEGRR